VLAALLPLPAFAQTVSIGGPAGPLAEGDTAVFTVTMTAAHAGDVSVPYTIAGAGITADDVHGALTGNSIAITRGDLSASFTLYILVDGAGAETGDMLTVTLGTPTVAMGAAPTLDASNSAVTVAIADSSEAAVPTAGTVTVTAESSAANAAPGDEVEFTVAISGFRGGISLVDWEVQAGATNPAAERQFLSGATRGSATARGRDDNYPFGTVTVPAGTDQSAAIEIPLAISNTLGSGGTFNYTVRLLRHVQYTDAGAPPSPLPDPYTDSTRPASAAGSILLPITSAVLTVQRPAPAADDPAGRFTLETLQIADLGSADISANQGGGTYTLREEPPVSERRRAQVILDSFFSFSLSSTRAGYAAIFAIDLCAPPRLANRRCRPAKT